MKEFVSSVLNLFRVKEWYASKVPMLISASLYIFALNEVTHPGEKRLVQKCKEQCEILPNNFERNIEKLFEDLYVNPNMIEADISEIIKELERII